MTRTLKGRTDSLIQEHQVRATQLRQEARGMRKPLNNLKRRILDKAELHDKTARHLQTLYAKYEHHATKKRKRRK